MDAVAARRYGGGTGDGAAASAVGSGVGEEQAMGTRVPKGRIPDLESRRRLDPLWTELAWESINDGRLSVTAADAAASEITVLGACPRCTDEMTYRSVERGVAAVPGRSAAEPGISIRTETDTPAPAQAAQTPGIEVDVFCRCTYSHPGHPPQEPLGCGAVFRVALKEQNAGVWVPSRPSTFPGADALERKELWDEIVQGMLPRTAATAKVWGAGYTGLLTLLVSTVVVSGDSLDLVAEPWRSLIIVLLLLGLGLMLTGLWFVTRAEAPPQQAVRRAGFLWRFPNRSRYERSLVEAAVYRLGLGHACVIGGVAAFLLGVAFWLFSLPG
ncbi:hypothetical protein GCM10009526_21220 [Glutamicibacter creatinolyticus]